MHTSDCVLHWLLSVPTVAFLSPLWVPISFLKCLPFYQASSSCFFTPMTSVLERVRNEQREERIESFPRVWTQETLHKNPKMYHTEGGLLCCFQVEMARKGVKRAVCLQICDCNGSLNHSIYRRLKQIDVIMPMGWDVSLICHSLSLPVVHAGLVAGSKQDLWDFSRVDLLICPNVPQQKNFLIPAWKMFMNPPKTFHLTLHHHIMIDL